MKKKEYLPDHLRCNRTDGRQWRCNRPVFEDKKLCEIHFLQGRHRQKREKVPESLKLERKTNNSQNQEIGGKKKGKELEKRKRSESEIVDEAVKKMKLKKGDLQLELIREYLKRKVEKKKERGLKQRETEKKEVVKELPFGVMSITPAQFPHEFNNGGDVKLVKCSSFQQRRFRSKNIEPEPIYTMKNLPAVRDAAKLKKAKRQKCHWCRKSSYRILIKCLKCRKQFFCVDCIEERRFVKEEVKRACPICHGTCSCRACSTNQSKTLEHKDSCKDIEKVVKLHQLNYLIQMLLPVLEDINRYQSFELEVEAKLKGATHFEMHIPQVKSGCMKLNCCNCNTSIVDLHRSCASCSYILCLTCCLEFRQGKLSGWFEENRVVYPNRKRASMSNGILQSKRKQSSTSRQGSGIKLIVSAIPNWEVCENGRIPCPPNIFGGCGNNILDLRCMFSFGWTKELQVHVNDLVGKYDFPETSDVGSCCAFCRNTDRISDGFKLLLESARREDPSDNFLYYPTIGDLHTEKLEHFQKHWAKGHPVIVRNTIQGATNMCWDPVTIFCSYLGTNNAKSQNEEAINATNFLDQFEVEIGNKQFFMGSLEGKTHAYICRETVKIKGWFSSNLLEEHFSALHSEIMNALPLKEYVDPRCGALNLAVELTKEMPKHDLGPCICIAYGEQDDFMEGYFVTRLCYHSCDVVNILAHATDNPVSTKDLSRLKTLLKKCKDQDHRKSTESATDQPFPNQVEKKSSLNSEGTKEVTGKSSIHSEVTEESVLQDVIEENMNPPEEIAKVSMYSVDSHKGDVQSIEDQNMSNVNNPEHEYDSQATIFCSGIAHRFEEVEDDNSFHDDIENSNCSKEKPGADSCGAQWDIFRREDVPKLLEFLRKYSNEFSQEYRSPKKVIHPILDQIYYLNAFHKMLLKEEFNVEPWTFEQKVGEAVIVPAGCPYQVRKLKSCVNVILEFISPENALECVRLADELRSLPLHHKAKGKVLEVEKLTLHAIGAAIDGTKNLMCLEEKATEEEIQNL